MVLQRQDFTAQTKALIDNLKGVTASYGLGNDGNEYKIITQTFLYKFMNDKFGYEVKQIDPKLEEAENWEQAIREYDAQRYEMLLLQLPPDSAKLKREHFISYLHKTRTAKSSPSYSTTPCETLPSSITRFSRSRPEAGAKVHCSMS